MNPMNLIPGKKTYALSIAFALSVIGRYVEANFDENFETVMSIGELIDQLYLPFAAIFLRKGINGG